MTICKDLKNNEDVRAIYFDGSNQSIKELQQLLYGSNQLDVSTLHTKLNWWAIKYSNGTIIWKRDRYFALEYKIIK